MKFNAYMIMKRLFNVSTTLKGHIDVDLISLTSVNLLKTLLEDKHLQQNRTDTSLKDNDTLPLGYHWLLFREKLPTSSLSKDGYKRLQFEDKEFYRRVLYSGSLQYIKDNPLLIGQSVTSKTQYELLSDTRCISEKLVNVKTYIYNDKGLSIVEEQCIAHINEPHKQRIGNPSSDPITRGFKFLQSIDNITPITLFRFSSLTFNSHRIHWDIEYARKSEKYKDLVIPGQLIICLLLNFSKNNSTYLSSIKSVSYRFTDISYCNNPIMVFSKKFNSSYLKFLTYSNNSLTSIFKVYT